MYKKIIEKYIGYLSLDDINNYCKKNNIILNQNEDKIIYNYIKNDWEKIYDGDDNIFKSIKKDLSFDTYQKAIALYNDYKNKLK